MPQKNSQMIREETARRGILEHLEGSIRERLGNKLEMTGIVDLDYLATEVLLTDQAGHRFCARVYQVNREEEAIVGELWSEYGQKLKSLTDSLSLRTHGMQRIGRCLAHVAAAPRGMDLETYLRQVGISRPQYAIRVIIKVIDQLAGPATKGFHHPRSRPSEIVLTRDGGLMVKNIGLADFETALADRLGLRDLEGVAYAAPEQTGSLASGIAVDIYRLGVILFRMVTGKLPFEGSYEVVAKAHREQPMPNPQVIEKSVPVGLARVLMRMLAKDPAQRFDDFTELKTALTMLQPAPERARLAGGAPKKLSEKDEEQLRQQLADAKKMCAERDTDGALRNVESVLMVAGPREDAVKLHNQIWEIAYGPTIKRHLEESATRLEKRRVAATLSSLNAVLALAPGHSHALRIQARVFDGVKQRLLDPRILPVESYLGKAVEAKSDGVIARAEALWSMVVLAPLVGDEEARKKLQFEKQLASRGLDGLKNSASDEDSSLDATVAVGELERPVIDEPDEDATIAVDAPPTPPPAPVPPETNERTAPEPPEMDAKQAPEPTEVPDTELDPLQRAEREAARSAITEVEDLGDDVEELFEAPPAPPSKSEAPAQAPAAEASGSSMLEEENFFDDPPEENYFDEPGKGSAAVAKPRRSGKGLNKKLLMVAGAIVTLLVIAGVVALLMVQKQKRAREEADAAFQAAADLEAAGQWDDAMVAWAAAHEAYPDHTVGPEAETAEFRERQLARRIEARDREIEDYSSRARAYMLQGLLVGEDANNAQHYIEQIRELDPDNEALTELMDEIRTQQLTAARTFLEEEDFPAANEAYTRLRTIDPEYSDPEIEGVLQAWVRENVIEPEMKKLRRAVERKRWDEAFEIAEGLRPEMSDPEILDQYWEAVYVDHETLYNEALAKSRESDMLSALEVMTRIRPEDTGLMERKDKLSRDINLSKITDLEDQIQTALRKKQHQEAARLAKRLLRMESKNKVAENALDEIRLAEVNEIRRLRNGNPRAALARYERLLKISDWASYRRERDALKKRVNAFDQRVAALEGLSDKPLSEQKAAIDAVLSDFSEFTEDTDYKALSDVTATLGSENERLTELLTTVSRAADNPAKSYASILGRLKQEPAFSSRYARNRVSRLIDTYTDKIENYDGNVTLLIKTAKGLDLLRARRPRGTVLLLTGDATCRTVEESLDPPAWNHTCRFEAQAGAPLVFRVFQTVKRREEPLGELTIPKVPKTQKNLELKSADGTWSLIVDVRRER